MAAWALFPSYLRTFEFKLESRECNVVVVVVVPVGVSSTVAATSAPRINASADERRDNATDALNIAGAVDATILTMV